jgi:hypothetical protein
MKKLIASVLMTLALVVTANAQSVQRPVPQFVESLSDADYATWAQWQNRQAERRSKELSAASITPRYNHALRVESSGSSRGSAFTRSRANSARGGTASNHTTRNGSAATQFRRRDESATTAYSIRYNNPDYVGPGPVTIYNPWARTKDGKGTPDWDRIFVPVKEGTMTVSEVMDRLSGPYSQEKIFKLFISDYFSESEVQ